MENECQFCGEPAVAELCEPCLNDDSTIGEQMDEYKEKLMVIPDVETQVDDLNLEIAYWRTQAIVLRERNVALEKENQLMNEIINEEWPLGN